MKKHSKDKEYILTHIRYKIDLLEFVNEQLLKDKEFVLKLVEINGLTLKYVHHKLRNNKDVVMQALRHSDGFALKYASKELRANREVVYEAIKRWKSPLKYASPLLRKECTEKIEEYYKKHKQ